MNDKENLLLKTCWKCIITLFTLHKIAKNTLEALETENKVCLVGSNLKRVLELAVLIPHQKKYVEKLHDLTIDSFREYKILQQQLEKLKNDEVSHSPEI